MPIFALARAVPIVHIRVPLMLLACAPKTCSTRMHAVDLVRLLPFAYAVSGLQRLPLLWMWLFSFRGAQRCLHHFEPIGRVSLYAVAGIASHSADGPPPG